MIVLMNQQATAFAAKHSVPVFKPTSQFPKYFATHKLSDSFDFSKKFLKSSDELGSTSLTLNIDRYLGTTNNVFFALGKGYLETKSCTGLLYDPFELIKLPNAYLVENDFLYILNATNLLQQFCLDKRHDLEKLIPPKYSQSFWQGVETNVSLLIGDTPNSPAHIFDDLLIELPSQLQRELSELLKEKIIKLNLINNNIDEKIKNLFLKKNKILNTFSDQHSEEQTIELQVPKQVQILHGLIGVFIG